MKKYLLLAMLVLLGNAFTQAHAQCTNSVAITNITTAPSTIQGNVVTFLASGLATQFSVYLDGVVAATFYDFNTQPGVYFTAAGSLTVSYGTHTILVGGDTCARSFTTVPPPAAPGTSVLSTTRTYVRPNQSYTLSWTVPSGSVNHYTMNRTGSGGSDITNTYPSNVTSLTMTSGTPPGTTKFLTFKLHACSTTDETSCSAWSNSVTVEVDAPCVGGCP